MTLKYTFDIENKFKDIEQELKSIHDDVLILKTQRDGAAKAAAAISAAITLLINIAMFFWRR